MAYSKKKTAVKKTAAKPTKTARRMNNNARVSKAKVRRT